MENPAAWLRWQLARRGGLLWHETCATCQYWERDEGPADADGHGYCHNVWIDHNPHAEDACSDYHELLEAAYA